MQTQLKDGIARALQAKTSFGAQNEELTRVIADLDVICKQYGETTINDNHTRASTSSPTVGDGNPNPNPSLADIPNRPQARQQETTLAAAPGWSNGLVPPEDCFSWPGSIPPMRPFGASMQQTGPQMAGPIITVHPTAVPPTVC